MHSLRSLQRLMVVAATAGLLSVGIPHFASATPANAAVGARFGWDGSRSDEPPSRSGGNNTTTATATCGNGLVVLGPIIVPVVPNTTTVIQCQQAPPAAGTSR